MNRITITEKDDTKTPVLKAGQLWLETDTDEVYILANTSNRKYQLIALNDGLRWTGPVDKIDDVFGLSGSSDFTLLQNQTVTIKTP